MTPSYLAACFTRCLCVKPTRQPPLTSIAALLSPQHHQQSHTQGQGIEWYPRLPSLHISCVLNRNNRNRWHRFQQFQDDGQ
mmetsp:Transcript_14608/g.29805  ORF Transcript_14608/g.29805 Transcript_14608/m.29805 type:complete len:81 (+) Transcript_14608:263-505(+)